MASRIYKARDPRLNRFIAIKLLPGPAATDPDRRERFAREAQAVAALNHPNIVTIHSTEEIDGRSGLTMELVEGRTLAEAIPRGGLPLDRLLQIAIPVADAVRSARHARRVEGHRAGVSSAESRMAGPCHAPFEQFIFSQRSSQMSPSTRQRLRLSGGGIAPEHLPHVFERFYKVDASRAAESTGSGLGLSITKAIIERHGGTIRVTSHPGRTTFTVLLPQSSAI